MAVESLIATFSQDVWNDCAEALADSETPEDEEEGIWCHEPMVRDGGKYRQTDRQTGKQTDYVTVLALTETPEDEEGGIWCHEPVVKMGTDMQKGTPAYPDSDSDSEVESEL